jgi:hypothetical protein
MDGDGGVMGWTKEKLMEFLDRAKIRPDSYSLSGDKDEAYCIAQAGNEWVVYYSERGRRNELAWGKTEDQALDVLKLYLLRAHKQI